MLRSSRDDHWLVRQHAAQNAAVGGNRTAGERLLAELAQDNTDIACMVAKNPSVSAETLEAIIKQRRQPGQGESLLIAAASNPSCPPEMIERLVAAGGVDVVAAAASNPSASPQLLERLAAEPGQRARGGVAANSAASEKLLQQLGEDGDAFVRRCVASNGGCPAPLLLRLLDDSAAGVRHLAAETAALRGLM